MRKKNYFGDDHEILFDTVINHDVYAYLRVNLEVPRGQDTEAIINLNNRTIGKVTAIRSEGGTTTGYVPQLFNGSGFEAGPQEPIRELGKAIARVVTNSTHHGV